MKWSTNITEVRFKLYPKNFYKVRKFYEELLGFTVVKSWDDAQNHKGVMFKIGKSILEIQAPEKDYVPVKGSGLSLEVKNVKNLWKKLKNNVNITQPIQDNPWGDTSFGIADPEGFEIKFFTKQK